MKAKKFASLQPKKKCCKSQPRCLRCPVVLMRVEKAVDLDHAEKVPKWLLIQARKK
ncbi:hypothetical protein [Segniliparus rotundus]|uniref:hypothetical protein n=1 Tax=Segniliparus rotundus TaxID=286802 RepID=UPI0016519796|nr:hypothetical protein [Segniliparus rotundus]